MIPFPVYPSLDFETYSEAGFVWNGEAYKWEALPNATQGKRGLKVVGAAAYAEHPTTKVLTLSYDLRDGRGVRRWNPRLPPPMDLFEHIQAGGLLSGWNTAFEHHIWNRCCVVKYGWPPLPQRQLRCTMARARAFSLPGKLDAATKVMGWKGKDPEGERLIKKFCSPRTPTKGDARRRITPEEDPVDGEKLYSYCDQDVEAESSAAANLPPLFGEELEFWLADQAINYRGVKIDVEGVHNCIAIIEEIHSQYNSELRELAKDWTGPKGEKLEQASQLSRMTKWLGDLGVHTGSLDEEHIGELIQRNDLPPMARKALELRQAIGSAAVKKVFAMRNTVTRDGRLHDLFNYYGARTGRATGEGPQPTNLPNSGPSIRHCKSCGAYYATVKVACPGCGALRGPGKPLEWCPEAAEFVLELAKVRSMHLLQWFFGDAMAAVSGCLRGLFTAGEGYDLIGSDYSSIEAVVLAEVAGEEWRKEVFRTHGKIYEMSAAKISGISFEDFMEHAGYTREQRQTDGWWEQKPEKEGSHHPLRKTIGKVAELACFSPDTLVLTDRGYVAIVNVRKTDRLWDGVEWVTNDGVLEKGTREVVVLDGVRTTPTHPISIGTSWKEARELASSRSALSHALAIGSANLPSLESNEETTGACGVSWSSAPAVVPPMPLTSATSGTGGPHGATLALKRKAGRRQFVSGIRRRMTSTPSFSPTESIDGGSSTAFLRRLVDVETSRTGATTTTGAEESRFTLNGSLIRGVFYDTSRLCRDGTTLLWRWIERMLMGTTSPEISDSLPEVPTRETGERFKSSRSESTSWSPVYDIINAGPRHRFTIKTNSGHLIVHNSGYQGWVGSWKAFGADEFMSEEEMKQAILAWRKASPAVVELWGGQERNWKPEYYGVEGMFVQAVMYPGSVFQYRELTFVMRGDAVFVRLPSGRELTYHRPRLGQGRRGYSISYEGWNTNPKNGAKGWVRIETWGGRLVENIVQATARDILRHAIIKLEAAGYRVVLHVYDEVVVETPEGRGSVEDVERIMMALPDWASSWVIRAAGGWRGKRYRKG